MEMEWDVSQATRVKIRAILCALSRIAWQLGLRVWFDELTLTIGDSLRQSIDRGLANSRFGIVVISPSFLQKDWPQWANRREVNGIKVILPIWHNLGANEIRQYSPTLAWRKRRQLSGPHFVSEARQQRTAQWRKPSIAIRARQSNRRDNNHP
jgi:hypothetical protein